MNHKNIDDCIRELMAKHQDKEVTWWVFEETCDGNVKIEILMEKKAHA